MNFAANNGLVVKTAMVLLIGAGSKEKAYRMTSLMVGR